MDDKTLLELAAKAAGYDAVQPATFNFGCWMALNEGEWQPWNPLTDDGDALRLAVKLKFNVCHYGDCVAATPWQNPRETEEWTGLTGADPYAATRRAIVRSAASIGQEEGRGE